MTFDTIEEAARAFVREFDAIPQDVIIKLLERDPDELQEITPPAKYDHVYICYGDHSGEYGEIVSVDPENEDAYIVELDGSHDRLSVEEGEFDVERDDFLPTWGTMWSPPQIDQDWILGFDGNNHLQEVADCGFRIYEQEDYGVILGIDGAGYDFYESHWIPLYQARGLHWHKDARETA